MAGVTATVYRWVVDDVIAKMKPEVVQEGLDESVLDDLRSLWETKLNEKGLMSAEEPGPRPSGVPPGIGPGMQPPPVATGIPGFPFSGLQGISGVNPMALAHFTAQLAAAQRAAAAQGQLQGAGSKREAPESGFDPRVPQQRQPPPQNFNIPQRDGPGDEDGDEQPAEDAAQAAPDDDEDPLSSDSEEEEPEEDDHQHFLCCQFEKVGRNKNKWKIAMRDGVFHINGRDYLFKKAQGEWIF